MKTPPSKTSEIQINITQHMGSYAWTILILKKATRKLTIYILSHIL